VTEQAGGDDRTIKLVSIVAIDVVGFSTMSERDQRNTARKIEALRARLDNVATANGGRMFNTAGDGFMLEFGSAGSALGAIQDILDKRAKGEPKIRVGAHVGDVVVTATSDLLGHGVNIAARLQQLAAPGTALVSSEFRSMARSSPSAAFQAKGRQPLENIEQKVQTFEILSRRQKFSRLSRRVALGALGAAFAAGLVYVSPMAWRMYQQYASTQQQAQTANVQAPAADSAIHVTPVGEAIATITDTSTAPAAPAAPGYSPGQAIKDCTSCPDMIVVPGGLFQMGSPNAEAGHARDEGPQHEVSISPFAISKYEVTFQQWDACLAGGGCAGFSPADHGWGRGNHPVLGVSWNDAQHYLDWLNTQTNGHHYRLATEAEWEYAARAGETGAYSFHPFLTTAKATYRAASTSPVGSHDANAFGVFDAYGNVSEWVQDCYAATYTGAPVDGAAVDPAHCARRVYRGGGYADQAAALRAAARRSAAAATRLPGVGFRVVRVLN
jgi:formylglycine-generating enzyme required for sulfatase activity